MSSTKNKQKGFTIIELMLATTVFSLVLLMCMAAIIQISRLYYRGVTQTSTQEVTRQVTDEITQAIQFSNSTIFVPEGNPAGPQIGAGEEVDGEPAQRGFFCIGGKRYTYNLDRQLQFGDIEDVADKQASVGIWVDQPGGCAESVEVSALDIDNQGAIDASDGQELLRENMRVYKLNVVPVDIEGASTDSVWRVEVGVAYGDSDLLETNEDNSSLRCIPSGPGVEFCATSEISTTVQRRVK